MASVLSMKLLSGRGGRGSGIGRSARWIWVGEMRILFSYETPVAFDRRTLQIRREHISSTTSRHLSSACASSWEVKEEAEFDRELEAQLFAELNGWPDQCDFLSSQGIASKIIFDLVRWLREIDSVAWRRPTKLQEAVGMLATEAFRQLTIARHGTSEFDDELRHKLTTLIAEEARHRQQITEKAEPALPHGSAGRKSTKARRQEEAQTTLAGT